MQRTAAAAVLCLLLAASPALAASHQPAAPTRDQVACARSLDDQQLAIMARAFPAQPEHFFGLAPDGSVVAVKQDAMISAGLTQQTASCLAEYYAAPAAAPPSDGVAEPARALPRSVTKQYLKFFGNKSNQSKWMPGVQGRFGAGVTSYIGAPVLHSALRTSLKLNPRTVLEWMTAALKITFPSYMQTFAPYIALILQASAELNM